jgi:hypothetical protein
LTPKSYLTLRRNEKLSSTYVLVNPDLINHGFRALLEKRTNRLESKKTKLAILNQKIEEQKLKLAELSPVVRPWPH